MASFKRYIQVENQPRPIHRMIVKRGTEPYIPASVAYQANTGLTSLMDAAYSPGQGPTKFAGFFAEAEDYLRAWIGLSAGGEVLLLKDLDNLHAGEKGYYKVEDLIARALTTTKVDTAKINLIVFTNVDNATQAAMNPVRTHSGWVRDTWVVPQTADRVASMNATDLGRTAASIASGFRKTVTDVYVGAIDMDGVIAFGLGKAAARPARGTPPRVPASRVQPAAKRVVNSCRCCFLC